MAAAVILKSFPQSLEALECIAEELEHFHRASKVLQHEDMNLKSGTYL